MSVPWGAMATGANATPLGKLGLPGLSPLPGPKGSFEPSLLALGPPPPVGSLGALTTALSLAAVLPPPPPAWYPPQQPPPRRRSFSEGRLRARTSSRASRVAAEVSRADRAREASGGPDRTGPDRPTEGHATAVVRGKDARACTGGPGGRATGNARPGLGGFECARAS